MHPARIAELLQPFLGPANDQELTTNDLQNISTYIDILLRWNARINLTAIRDPEDIVPRHFGESLFAARHLFPGRELPGGGVATDGGAFPGGFGSSGGAVLQSLPRASATAPAAERRQNSAHGASRGSTPSPGPAPEGRKNRPEASDSIPNDQQLATSDAPTAADLGSGAGFPGLPLKLWAPHISLTLIESNHKKATFLREVARALTLTDVNIQNSRAEALTSVAFDLVTLRAVERFGAILPIAAALVAPRGRLALLISAPQADHACAALPNFSWSSPIPIPLSRSRVLLTAHRQFANEAEPHRLTGGNATHV